MEFFEEHERSEQGVIPREVIIVTPEVLAIRALIDHFGLDES
jgi:hypothetical protein